jgi:hypothetical protein
MAGRIVAVGVVVPAAVGVGAVVPVAVGVGGIVVAVVGVGVTRMLESQASSVNPRTAPRNARLRIAPVTALTAGCVTGTT